MATSEVNRRYFKRRRKGSIFALLLIKLFVSSALVGCFSIPDQTRYRLSLLVEREIDIWTQNTDLKIEISKKQTDDLKEIIYNSVSLTSVGKGESRGQNRSDFESQFVLESCNKGVEKVLLSSTHGPMLDDFARDFCYNILRNHLKLVVSRQHYAENIYEVFTRHYSVFEADDRDYYYGDANAVGGKIRKQIMTPELSYLISDLFPIRPDNKDCVIAMMRVMSLPFNLQRRDAELMCREILQIRKERVYYNKSGGMSKKSSLFNSEEDGEYGNNTVKITVPKSKLSPFGKAPPFIDTRYPHGIAGIKYSSERVSSSKKSDQGFSKLLSLPFVNSPVSSIKESEKFLVYSHNKGNGLTSGKEGKSSVVNHHVAMPKLNGREEVIFNDDIFSGLVLPCRTLNYEGKLLASILFYYAVYNKIPMTIEESCIVCMRTVYVVSISVPKDQNSQRRNGGIIDGEIFNPFIPTCIHSFMTLSTYIPNSKFSTEYLSNLVTSEAAARAVGKLCSKTMSRYIQIFGMIGIGNHNISCTPAQLLLLNSLQNKLWINHNALFSTNELVQVACRVNLGSNASQASSECTSLLDKITTNGISLDHIKLLCQETVKFLQPQPLVTTPILFTLSNILRNAIETTGGIQHYYVNSKERRPIYLVDLVNVSKKFVLFTRPNISKDEYISSCKALIRSNMEFIPLSEKAIHKICKVTFDPIKNIIMHYYTPQELQKYHRKQFLPRTLFIKKTITSFSKIIEKKLQIDG